MQGAKNTMDLSVIIVSYNSGGLLQKNIDSVIANTNGLDYEIVVVDNGSTDNSLGFIFKGYPQVNVIYNNANLGFSKANNIGINRSQGSVIVLLNQDIWLNSDALGPMYKTITENNSIGLLGCRIAFPDGRVQTSAYSYTSFGKQALRILSSPLRPFVRLILEKLPFLGRGKIIRTHFVNYGSDKGYIDVDYITGACMMFRREMIEKTGSLDETFFMYYEDEDLCRRVKNSGLRVVYMPSVSIVHNFGWGKNKLNIKLIEERQKSFNHYCNKYYNNRFIYYAIYRMFNLLLFSFYLGWVKIRLGLKI